MEGEYEVEIDLATASPDELGAFLIDGARSGGAHALLRDFGALSCSRMQGQFVRTASHTAEAAAIHGRVGTAAGTMTRRT